MFRHSCKASILLATAQSFVHKWDAIPPNTPDPPSLVIAGRTPDSILHQFPYSLNIPRQNTSATVANWEAKFPGLVNVHTVEAGDFPYIVDESQCAVVVHTVSSGASDRGSFELEVLWTQFMAEGGEEVQTLWGFADANEVAGKNA